MGLCSEIVVCGRGVRVVWWGSGMGSKVCVVGLRSGVVWWGCVVG